MKDPAFLFYPGDWLGGTITFNRSHKGAYMDILMAQFNSGHLWLEDIMFILGNDFETMWESKLKSKFIQDSEGRYYNEKLESELIKRKNFTKSRRDNLNSNKKNDIHMDSHMGSLMENGNDNIDINNNKEPKKKKKQFEPPTLEQVKAYFAEKGYNTETAIQAFNYYSAADWHDSEGKPVLNWKQKMIAVWFKPENKIAEQSKNRYPELRSTRILI